MGDLSNKFDDMKGRAKEAAGDLTEDDELKRKGKVDQAAASAKDKVDKVKDKVSDILDRDK